MDMIHTSWLTWTAENEATYTISTSEPAYIPHDDPIYLAGGYAQRVLITNSFGKTETRDVQLCEELLCRTCSGHKIPDPTYFTDELRNEAIRPVVHSQDVQKIGKEGRFEPVKGREYSSKLPEEMFERMVKFLDGKELVVQVCEGGSCEQCGGARPE